ncbi:hypothetical protein SAMN05877753_10214 [Bacillus oleivorans]|uniref:Uncharacterized protein n=1 Tax=Bacillus oleivorans TaxID=1448271 RepID=A0A285CJW2_9BACI|nr:hypothetical protein [Bacillus oleivorans]SNX67810.1 hypothetical protein SAMN05877753_10214 [Bacillus oleivorans]
MKPTPTVVMEIPYFLGQNTAQSFSEIDIKESRKMLNFLPRSIGSLANRDGTVPITDTAIGEIKVLCNLRKGGINYILATSGNTLYRYQNGVLTAQTMTVTLTSPDIDYAQFKDDNANEVLVITDGGKLKAYDGTQVYEVVPAPDDASPLPPNDLANINTNHPPKGCLVHNTRLVIWDGSDTIWHSKIGFFDYFAQVDYQRFVRENDSIQTCITYGGALLVFLRRHIGVLFGHDVENWTQDFIDTNEGCLNPKTVQIVTFPNGRQEVFYLSDNGVHAVYTIDTVSLDSSARYSTKSMTKDKINWEELGVTKDEWKRATSYFHNGRYWLIYPKGAEWHGLVFDTESESWYPIDNVKANSFYHDEDYFYFAGPDGHIKVFDDTLYSDYDDKAKTVKTPLNKYWYSKLMTPELTGHDHFWDILMVEARQFQKRSSIDVEVNTYRNQFNQPSAIKTAMLIWGETEWGESQWTNPLLTDYINNAKRLKVLVKGQYSQVKLSNNRDEPVEILSLKYEVRRMR